MKRDATDYIPRPATWIAPDGPADHRVIRVRVSPGQRQTFDAAAQRTGKTLSGWLRDLATEAAGRATSQA
jgi:uncharacterized protein (DUF1778 family)